MRLSTCVASSLVCFFDVSGKMTLGQTALKLLTVGLLILPAPPLRPALALSFEPPTYTQYTQHAIYSAVKHM